MKLLILVTALMLTGCANSQRFGVRTPNAEACLNTGAFMDLIKIEMCATIGNADLRPEGETPDAVDQATDS